MAFSGQSLGECRPSTGNAANSGWFSLAGGVLVVTDLTATSATSASPVVSSGSYSFVSGDVNSYLYIASGTNWTPGLYLIASVSGSNATLDASTGALRSVAG